MTLTHHLQNWHLMMARLPVNPSPTCCPLLPPARSEATAEGLRTVGASLESSQGGSAAQLRVAEAYVDAFRSLAREGNTILLPASLDSPATMIAQVGWLCAVNHGILPGSVAHD
jgi:hypothetical protein